MRDVAAEDDPLFVVSLVRIFGIQVNKGVNEQTYGNEETRNCGQDGEHEYQRHDLGGALGVGPEDMVDLLELAVPERLLVGGRRGDRIAGYLDVEDFLLEAFGGAEGGDHEGGFEGVVQDGELDGEIALLLWYMLEYEECLIDYGKHGVDVQSQRSPFRCP